MTTKFKHYKGGIYELICEATMEADLMPLIVYRAPDGSIWCRPRHVFFEQISVNGTTVQRFTTLPEEESSPLLQGIGIYTSG